MSSVPRRPGESVRDWTRRNYKWQGLDPDLAGPATDGARFAGESVGDWLERLRSARLPSAFQPPKADEDEDDER
jgi:hypothetical protein